MSRIQIIGFWGLVHTVIISSDPEAPLSEPEEQQLHVSTPRGSEAGPPQNGEERRSAYPGAAG